MNVYVYVWIAVMVIMLLAECLTLGLTTIWFAVGSFVSAILAFCNVDVTIQMIVFLIVSLILIALIRPYAKNVFNRNIKDTNTSLLIGKEAVVYERIDSVMGTGRVKINGQEWMAKSETEIPENTKVIITGIQGASLLVKFKERKEL